MIELRNDREIVSMLSTRERIAYMQTLEDMALMFAEKDLAFSVAFGGNSIKQLKRRLLLLAEKGKISHLLQTALAIVLIFLLMGSYMIVIEPYSLEKGEAEEGVWLTEENTVLIRNGEEYDVYVEGEYQFTTDDLHPFQGIVKVKIYDSIEEYEGEMK